MTVATWHHSLSSSNCPHSTNNDAQEAMCFGSSMWGQSLCWEPTLNTNHVFVMSHFLAKVLQLVVCLTLPIGIAAKGLVVVENRFSVKGHVVCRGPLCRRSPLDRGPMVVESCCANNLHTYMTTRSQRVPSGQICRDLSSIESTLGKQ